MYITEIKNDKANFDVKVTVPSNEIDSEIEKRLARLVKETRIDGFRPGKVPTLLLRKKYGPSLRIEVIKDKITKTMFHVVKSKNLRTLIEPRVEDIKNDEEKDLEFTLKYDLLPEIVIPDLKNIVIEKPVLELEDRDINEQIQKIASSLKEYKEVRTSEAKKGDQVTINAIGDIEGKVVTTLRSYKLILGNGFFIPNFEEKLIGLRTGDNTSIKVTFPEDYYKKKLSNKTCEFKVKILEIHGETEVQVNDSFAKKLNFENLGALKEQVTKNLQELYKAHVENMLKKALFEKLENENIFKFTVPQNLINEEVKLLTKRENQEQLMVGLQNLYKIAEQKIKKKLFILEYARSHKLEIDEIDIKKAIMYQVKNFPGKEKEIVNFYLKYPKHLESLKARALEDKVIESILKREVKLIEVPYTKGKLEEILTCISNG